MKKLGIMMLVLIMALSCVAIAACGGGDDDEEATQEPTQAQTEEPTGGDTGDSDDMMGFDSYDELDSYKITMKIKGDMPMIGETEMVIEEKIDNEKDASHSVMDFGMGKMETITIGNEEWTKMAMQNKWSYYVYEDYEMDDFEEDYDFADDFDFENDLDYKGKETVNGVKCKKYDVDSMIMMDNPDPNAMGGEVESNFVGTIWIADEGGLPEVPIRMIGTAGIETAGMEMDMDYEVNVTDINKDMDIEAPPDDEVMEEGDWGDWGDMDMDDFEFDEDDFEDMFGDLDLDELMGDDFDMSEFMNQ